MIWKIPEKYIRGANKGHKLDSGTFLSLRRKFVNNDDKKELSKQIRKQVKGLLD